MIKTAFIAAKSIKWKRGNKMSKYKPGDKFLIEIEGVNQESAVSKFVDYKINGSDLAVYEGYLDEFKMIKPGEIEKVGYEDGLKDAFYAAKMIEFDVKEGGIDFKNLIKIFGFSSLKSIIFNFEPKEIVEKIKRFKECQGKFCVGDVVKSKNNEKIILVVTQMCSDGDFKGIKISETDEYGRFLGYYDKRSAERFEKTGKHFNLEELFNLDKGE